MPDGESTADSDDASQRCRRLLDTELIRRYRSTLKASLDEPEVRAELVAWRSYVKERHGDVFARLADEEAPVDPESKRDRTVANPSNVAVDQAFVAVDKALFVETLTFDFLLSELLDIVENRFGCSVSRPLTVDAGIDFAAEFAAVHEFVASRLSPKAVSSFHSAAVEFVESATPYDVAVLHRECVSPLARRAFGRYDTPAGLAELAVDEVFRGIDEEAGTPLTPGRESDVGTERPLVVDPGCGAGAFLAAAATRRRKTDRNDSPADRIRAIFDSVRGFDVAPNAVRAARVALVLAVRPLLDAVENPETPTDEPPTFTPRVVLGDASEVTAEDPPLSGRRADAVLINPPWLTWDSLSEAVKGRWRTGSDEDRELDLFDHRGLDARLGYANDDLSVPYTLRCVHHLLRDGGRVSAVLKRDLLTGPAGERLRRSEVGGRAIRYDRVHDFGSLTPFSGVDAGTALFALRVGSKGESNDGFAPVPTEDGIPMIRWHAVSEGSVSDADPPNSGSNADASNSGSNADPPKASGRIPSFESLSAMETSLKRSRTHLRPSDPDAPSSPWLHGDAERAALGTCPYRIRHGVKDDAKAVYAVDAETIEQYDLESDHVYPYLKSKHIVKYGLFGHDLQLVPQRRVNEDNEDEIRTATPATFAYLDAHRDRLLDRGSSWFDDGPFYSLFGVGPYTWSEYKVVWCRLGFKPHFAVVSTVADPIVGEKAVVPGDHCMFVATDDEREAHYLCALLNSAPYQRCLRDISSGGKSSLSKSTVEQLALSEWTAAPRQRRLAECSQRAHAIVPDHVDCSKRAYNEKTIPELASVQHEIDRTVERFLVDDVGDGT